MKKIVLILISISLVALISCRKENVYNGVTVPPGSFPEISAIVDVAEPVASLTNGRPDTRILHSESAGVHTITWKAGDEFSMFGYFCEPDSYKGSSGPNGGVVNYSANRISLTGGDGTTQFRGSFPDLNSMYGYPPNVKINQVGIYPAATVNVTMTSTSAYSITPVTPISIATTQDGTGWRYALFFSRSAVMTSQYNNPAAGDGIKFKLGNLMLRLNMDSTKDVTGLTVTSSGAYLVGDATALAGGGAAVWINSGCLTKTLTVTNGGVLPNELYLAVRQFKKDWTYTFVFEAYDGTHCTKTFKSSADREKVVLNMGTVTLDTWE